MNSSSEQVLQQLLELSKTMGLVVQDLDQLRSDNTGLQMALKRKSLELNSVQYENNLLRNRCQQLENELKKSKINSNDNVMAVEDVMTYDSQNSWDTQSEEYLANLSNDELLNGNEIMNQTINHNNGLVENKQNSNSTKNNENKKQKTNDNTSIGREMTEPIASTSRLNNNCESNGRTNVKTNFFQILDSFITSTQKPKVKNHNRSDAENHKNENIKITIRTMSGKRMIFQVNSNDTVQTVKRKLEEREGFPCIEHRLIYNGIMLSDDKQLFEYNIKNGSVINCVLRLLGAKH